MRIPVLQTTTETVIKHSPAFARIRPHSPAFARIPRDRQINSFKFSSYSPRAPPLTLLFVGEDSPDEPLVTTSTTQKIPTSFTEKQMRQSFASLTIALALLTFQCIAASAQHLGWVGSGFTIINSSTVVNGGTVTAL